MGCGDESVMAGPGEGKWLELERTFGPCVILVGVAGRGQNRGVGDEVRGEDITPALLYSLPTHTINIGRVSLDCATAKLLKQIYPLHSNIL